MKPTLKLVEDTGSQLEPEVFDLPPQQAEMPFAIVDGEPVTQMPKDLYIPPDALQVILEAFEGPLDLLLYLIRRQNLDILDIPIAEITKQYMQYIEVMAEMQLELAGEYLLMAAMLAEIKSRMLLPRPPAADGQEEEDPRAELVRRLQEYERFKQAAEDIDQLPRLERDTMVASAELIERKVVRIPPQVSLQEMLLAFRDVLQRADMFAHHQVQREALSIRQRMSDILSTLGESAFQDFSNLFKAEEGRMGVTVTFIAILQLMKDGLIEIVQAEPYAPIHVRPASGARHLAVVGENAGAATSADADAENEAALAQPAYPDEDEDYVEPDVEITSEESEEDSALDDATLQAANEDAGDAPGIDAPEVAEASSEDAGLADPSDEETAAAQPEMAAGMSEGSATATDESVEQAMDDELAQQQSTDAADEPRDDRDPQAVAATPRESSADDTMTPAGEDDETTGQAQ